MNASGSVFLCYSQKEGENINTRPQGWEGSYSVGRAAARMGGSYSMGRAAARVRGPTAWRGLLLGWGSYSVGRAAARMEGCYSVERAAARMWGSYSVRKAAVRMGGSYSVGITAARVGGPIVWGGLPPGWGGPIVWGGLSEPWPCYDYFIYLFPGKRSEGEDKTTRRSVTLSSVDMASVSPSWEEVQGSRLSGLLSKQRRMRSGTAI